MIEQDGLSLRSSATRIRSFQGLQLRVLWTTVGAIRPGPRCSCILNKFLYTVYSNRRNSKKPLDEERDNLDARTSRVLELTLGLICRPARPSDVSTKQKNILLPCGSQHSCQTTVHVIPHGLMGQAGKARARFSERNLNLTLSPAWWLQPDAT